MLAFIVVVALMFAVDGVILHSPGFLERPEVRSQAASIFAARFTLPAGHRELVADVRYLAIPFEIALLTLIVIGVRRTQHRLAIVGIELDVPERIRALLGGSAEHSGIADIVATEASLLLYAFAAWRRRPFVPAGALGFSCNKRNALAAIP